MENIILALGLNRVTNKVEQIAVGTNPWSGIKIVDLIMLNPNNVEFTNAYIGFNGELINRGIELSHYSKYDIATGEFIQKSYHILVKAKVKCENVYFITDGLNKPFWASLDQIYNEILSGRTRLANARITSKDGLRYISSIKGEIPNVDYKEYTLGYRAFLKQSMRKIV